MENEGFALIKDKLIINLIEPSPLVYDSQIFDNRKYLLRHVRK